MTSCSENVCPVCGSDQLRGVIDIASVPVYCNVLLTTREKALQAPRGDLRMGFCTTCGHLFNSAFDPALLDYTPDYESSLHCSPRFQRYAEKLADGLIERHNLYGKQIVEIACGKGDFMKLLCQRGGNRGIGYDPSSEIEGQQGDITFVRDYFGGQGVPAQFDIVCCRHALEHIHFPTDFLREIKKVCQDRSPVLFFEVPNGLYTLRDLGIWDLIYEHCSYFWAGSLQRAFKLAGFRISRVQVDFDEQFICLEALPGAGVAVEADPAPGLEVVSGWVTSFQESYQQKVASWNMRLEELNERGARVVVWGAGSKGVTFLNVVGASAGIKYLVDLNPKKQGRFVPGTGQQVVSPEFLVEFKPEVVVVMNPAYQSEIVTMSRRLGIDAAIVTA